MGDAVPAFASNGSGHDTARDREAGFVFIGWALQSVSPDPDLPGNVIYMYVAMWEFVPAAAVPDTGDGVGVFSWLFAIQESLIGAFLLIVWIQHRRSRFAHRRH
jgi:hypothetical protein